MLIVDLTCEATGSVGTELEMALRPHNFEAAEWLQLKATLDALSPDRQKRQYRLHLDKPALWWTWDHGKPNLYQLRNQPPPQWTQLRYSDDEGSEYARSNTSTGSSTSTESDSLSADQLLLQVPLRGWAKRL
jgi:hypothetical protein